MAQNILVGLMKSRLLMNTHVWSVAAECWQKSLIHIQCLADSTSNLGRSVISLFNELYNDNIINSLEVSRPICYYACI